MSNLAEWWNHFRSWALFIGAFVLFGIGFGKGKNHERQKQKSEILETLRKAKNIRDRLVDPDVRSRLHDKYKR